VKEMDREERCSQEGRGIPEIVNKHNIWQKSTTIRVVDAVMGTGKSTWVIMQIKANPATNFIIVLPMLSELKRYEQELYGINSMVSLYDGTKKKDRFDEAIGSARVILITHVLFEEYLNDFSFELLEEKKWNLIMDEVVTAFEPTGADHITVRGLIERKVLSIKSIDSTLKKFDADLKRLDIYLSRSDHYVPAKTKEFLKSIKAKDLYGTVHFSPGETWYYSFSLREQRFRNFCTIMILTYPFKDTNLDYWFQIKGLKFRHLELTRKATTDSLSDFKLKRHSGKYSGSAFKHLIEFIDTAPKPRKKKYGEKYSDFSAGSMKDVFNPDTKSSSNLKKQKEVRNALINLFRNKRRLFASPDEFMFTCKKESIPVFQDSKNGLSAKFIGEETFVAFNKRATNTLSHKYYLAYLYNAFPFPSVEQRVQSCGLTYNKDIFSLYVIIQWLWRSAIRNNKKIYLYMPSKRMRGILEEWLNK
jgi:hypothetical protein